MVVFAENGWLTGLTLGAVAMVIGWVLLRTHRHLSRHKPSNAPLVRVHRPQEDKPGHHLDASPEVLRWEIQMHETARGLSAQLDSKMGALRALIAEADRAAARLEAAGARSAEVLRQPLRTDPRPATQAEGLRAGPADRAASDTEDASGRSSARRSREEIYMLADYGLEAAEIARRVGSPVGEVELILGLRKQQ